MTGLGLSVGQLLQALASIEDEGAPCPLECFWVVADGDREGYVRELEAQAGARPLVGVVVREEPFDDPNGISQDVAAVLARSRNRFVGERTDLFRVAGRVQVILVAKRELRVASTASPIRLPDWFPVCPGEITYVGVTDVTWRADEPLSSPMLEMDSLRAQLFRIERVLVARIEETRVLDAALLHPLSARVFPNQSGHLLADSLMRAKAAALAVTDPAHFRPASGRSPVFIIAWLFRTINNCNFDGTHSTSTALATALRLNLSGTDCFYESLSTLMLRPSQPDSTNDAGIRFCSSLLLAIRATFVLSNGSAHADSYGSYPVNLLRAVAQDLRRGLRVAAEVLEAPRA